MTPAELITAFRAALDADETAVRAVAVAYGGEWTAYDDWVGGDNGADVLDEPGAPIEHIARYDPAFVLADIAAKRAVIDAHTGPHACPSYDWVTREIDSHMPVDAGQACTTLRLLAEAYGVRA